MTSSRTMRRPVVPRRIVWSGRKVWRDFPWRESRPAEWSYKLCFFFRDVSLTKEIKNILNGLVVFHVWAISSSWQYYYIMFDSYIYVYVNPIRIPNPIPDFQSFRGLVQIRSSQRVCVFSEPENYIITILLYIFWILVKYWTILNTTLRWLFLRRI